MVTVNDYIESLPEDRKATMQQLREVINANLPEGFNETISYGMIGWVVPHSAYAPGYHCDPKLPLPFLSIASQKNFIAVYHMGIYASKDLLDWFTAEYPKYVKTKLDIGKSCIRFKKPEAIPFNLIGELVAKMNVESWIELYEKNLKG
jgi:uncharacterized protein YdhG (YjbR/CyaY superfamily)